MDILKEFREFFCNSGIEQHIYWFRHPSEREQMFLTVKYIPETDSREYQYEEGDKEYNPLTDGLHTISLTNSFKKLFFQHLRSLKETCDKLSIISLENPSFIMEAFESPEPDFNAIRAEIRTNAAFGLFGDIALQHVTDVEAIYRKCKIDCKATSIVPNNKKKAPNGDVICFEYRGDRHFLSTVYYNLNLESGDFINKNKTSEQEFITIFTSANVQREAGRIFFECETRQSA